MFQIGGVIKRINRHSCCTIPASIIWGDKRQTLGIILRRARNPHAKDGQRNGHAIPLPRFCANLAGDGQQQAPVQLRRKRQRGRRELQRHLLLLCPQWARRRRPPD